MEGVNERKDMEGSKWKVSKWNKNKDGSKWKEAI